MTRLEKLRENLHKALEVYPFDSEVILQLSKELDALILKHYSGTTPKSQIKEK